MLASACELESRVPVFRDSLDLSDRRQELGQQGDPAPAIIRDQGSAGVGVGVGRKRLGVELVRDPPQSVAGLILASVGGLAFAGVWFLMLLRYRDLNKAKFEVIHELEKSLPAQPYTREQAKLERANPRWWRPQFAELGTIERLVPLVFAAIYAGAIIRFALL